jgi:tRNA modification GTPase
MAGTVGYKISDTICAPATGKGGAIAIVRMSGDEAIAIADKVFKAKSGKKLTESESHRLHYGEVVENGEVIDEALVAVFTGDRSYTGEPSVEFSLHDSPYITGKVMELLSAHGARPAGGGEFSMRAYLNGKLDLAQAEAVADLIGASSATAHKVAMRHLRGNYSGKIKELRNEFINFASLLELELDFSEEDVEFADRKRFITLIETLERETGSLLNSYRLGKVLKSGIPVAIAGKPNVGKSTLLNLLLEEERAIVTDIPGTTRDTIEDTVNINGYLFRFIDTAGIRKSQDTVENLGIERTLAKIEQASVVLYLTGEEGLTTEDTARINDIKAKDKKVFTIKNKADLTGEQIGIKGDTIIFSAKNPDNISLIINALTEYADSFGLNDRTIVTSARHAAALQRTLDDLKTIKEGFANDIPTDLIAIDVRNALENLREITGEITTDNLLGNIFGKFCIGK